MIIVYKKCKTLKSMILHIIINSKEREREREREREKEGERDAIDKY